MHLEPNPARKEGNTLHAADVPNVLGQLPENIASFFSTVSAEGFPEDMPKAQPWKDLVKGRHIPSPDGKLILACPKMCLYGTNNG